jgi:hypothetical protein
LQYFIVFSSCLFSKRYELEHKVADAHRLRTPERYFPETTANKVMNYDKYRLCICPLNVTLINLSSLHSFTLILLLLEPLAFPLGGVGWRKIKIDTKVYQILRTEEQSADSGGLWRNVRGFDAKNIHHIPNMHHQNFSKRIPDNEIS